MTHVEYVLDQSWLITGPSGTSLFGGKGTVIGTIVGALVIGLINNGLILMLGFKFQVQRLICRPRVLRPWLLRGFSARGFCGGRWFIGRATSFSSVCLMPLRSGPLAKNWRSRPLVFSFEPRCRGMRVAKPDVDLQAAGQFRVTGHFRSAVLELAPDWFRGPALAQHGGQAFGRLTRPHRGHGPPSPSAG